MDGVQGVPFSLLRQMGEAAVAGNRIAPEMALRYLRSHPNSQLGLAADRAYAEFDELFLTRYAERHGEGMLLRAPRPRLIAHYQPSSGGLVRRTVTLRDVPDVNASEAALHHVMSVAKDCSRDLDAYSRFLGRQSDAADTPEAISLLPVERMEARRPEAVASVRGWVHAELAEGHTVLVQTNDLLAHWAPDDGARKAHLGAVARLLSSMDVGIEPDVRYGASGAESHAVLFVCPDGGTVPWPRSAEVGVLFDHLGCVAKAGGGLSEEGREFVADHFERRFRLSEAELARASAALTLSAAISDGHAKRRGQHRESHEQADDLRLFVGFALCNGEVGPAVITALVKACGACGIEESEVYRRLHSLPLEDSGLVEARAPSEVVEYAIDSPHDIDDEPPGVVLDSGKLERRLADTAHVYELLGEVFSEADVLEDPALGQPPQADAAGVSAAVNGDRPLADLDDIHRDLALLLARQPEWSFAKAEELAGSVGLPLLSGAIDTINEVVIDLCGEPLLEGDDPVTVNDYAAAEALG